LYFKVEELVSLSLNQPVRLFVDNNTDVAHNLRQEFVRIRSNREEDRLAIITGTDCTYISSSKANYEDVIDDRSYTHNLSSCEI